MISIPPESPILFVDDDAVDRVVLEAVLERSDLQNEGVFLSSGQDAIEYLGAAVRGDHPLPQLVILDVNMPGMTGFDVLERMNESPELSERPPVVMLSSSDAGRDKDLATSLGANGYLLKQSGIAAYVAMFNDSFSNRTTAQPLA